MTTGLIGTAWVEVLPETAGFAPALDAESEAGFAGFRKDAKAAGEDAGSALRTGVKDEAGKIEGDLGEAGAASGLALRDGVKDGARGIEGDLASVGTAGGASLRSGVKGEASKLESDLGDIGSAGGANLRKGVEGETGKLGDDLEKDGEKGGDRLSKGIGSGMSKLAGVISNTGLPLGGLSSKLDEAGKAMQDTDHKSSGLSDSLSHLGGYALLGVGAAAVVAGVAGVKMAEGMQTADASIAGTEKTSTKFATNVGNAFLDTAGKSEFSGQAMAKAFAPVAGQLESTEGHVLSAGESLHVMSAASDLAEAKQMELGSATEAVSKTMQAFGLKTSDAAHVSDVLFSASDATGQGVEALASQLTKVHSKLGETGGSVGDLASLLVDMTNNGVTGRAAMTGLNGGLSTLLKTTDGVAAAAQQQKTAYAAMTPALQGLAKQYESGSITAKQFKTESEALAPQQANLVTSYTKASTAVQTAQLKYKEMGITVFDSQGKFVGMGSVIDQLHPKFDKMTEAQRRLTAETLFGKGAGEQMTKVIVAGPDAYDKATAAVNRQNAAQAAAKKQAETLHGEEKALGAEVDDLTTRFGELLIPIVTKMVATFVNASTFVLHHKEILIGLAIVVGGMLSAAIGVFTVNKMSAFASSFSKASGTVKQFASDVEAGVSKVIAQFHAQEAASDEATANLEGNATKGDDALMGMGTAAQGAEAEVGTAVAGEAQAVGAADGTIETENATAGASFTAIGLAAVAAAGVVYGAVHEMEKGLEKLTGESQKVKTLLGGNQVGEAGKEGEVFASKHGGYAGSKDLTGSDTTKGAAEDLEKLGLSPAAAAGIAGTLDAESGLRPTAENPAEGAYGVAQWTDGRKAGLKTFAAGNKEDAASLSAQLKFLVHELETSEKGTGDALKGAKSSSEAAAIFVKDFERPESPSTVTARAIPDIPGTAGSAVPSVASGGPSGTPSAASLEKAAHANEQAEAKAKKNEEAAQKEALDREVKAQEKGLANYTSKALADEAKSNTMRRGAIAQELSEHKTFVATQIAEEKKGLSVKAATDKAKDAQEAKDQEKGESERTKLSSAIQSKSLATLNKELTKTHEGALHELEGKLDATHKSALEKLSAELEKTWKAATAEDVKLQAVADREAWEKTIPGQAASWEQHNREARELEEAEARTPEGQRLAAAKAQEEQAKAAERASEEQTRAAESAATAQADAITKASTLATDEAANKVQEVGDATKVTLDKQAEAGLSGTAEIAAHLQTVLDEVTGVADKEIGAAKLAQDQAAGTGVVAEAQAAANLANVENAAKIREAEAQAREEIAKGNAASTTNAQSTANTTYNFYGTNMTASDISAELAWMLKTGSLPAAPPEPVPA